MQRQRILQVIKGLDLGGMDGGAELFGATLAKELSRERQVDLCIFWQRGTPAEREWLERLRDSRLNIFFASVWKRKYHLASYLAGFRSIAARYPARSLDIAHSHFQVGSIAVLLLKALRKTRKIVRTAHIAKEWGTGWADALYRLTFSSWIFPGFMDKEVGVSPAVVENLRKKPAGRLLRRRPIFIPTATLPLEPAQPGRPGTGWLERLPEELERLPEERRIIGSVGRLTGQKDYQTLLEAFARIKPAFPGLFLVLVGDGELRAGLEEQARRLKVASNVLFLGTRPEARQIMREFEVFVLPSRWEGLPIVILESMAEGVPIIATGIPGTRDLIENKVTGWLVPPGNPAVLAEAIRHALEHPDEGACLAQAAKDRVQAFSMPKIAGEYGQLYDTLFE